jgi:hypothetical protein
MITLEEFKHTIKVIQEHEKDSDILTKTMLKKSIGIIDYGFDIVAHLVKLLEKVMDDKDKWISWWLWEDVEKIVYNGKEPVYDLTAVEDLYYYCKKQYDKVKKISH